MYTLSQFVKSGWSLVIYKQKRVFFRSQASDLKPLINYIKNKGLPKEELVIFDKYVGRAAALLIILIKPMKLYTPVISQGGFVVLKNKKISFEYMKKVKYLMNIASNAMCQWEKLAQNKSARTFLNLVKKMQIG